jgi:hypothetical protein
MAVVGRDGMSVTTAAGGALKAATSTAGGYAQAAREGLASGMTHGPVEGAKRAYAGQMGNDLVGVMLVIVIAATVGYVGLNVLSTTEQATDVQDGSRFDNASSSLTTGVESAFSLAEVVFIVLFLGIIITVLVGLRRR